MANHKSALKRHKQSLKRRMRNRMNKSRVKTAVRKVEAAIAASSVDEAKAALAEAVRLIDRTASKGTFHRNTASRKVSRLTRRVNAFIASMQDAA